MGVDIHIKLFKYDRENNIYDKITLYYWDYKKGKHEEVYIFSGRNSEMFDGMMHGDEVDGYGYFPTTSIALNSLLEPERKEYERLMKIQGCYDFCEINLAEMALYCKRHPEVTDYDVEWNDEDPNFVKPKKKNPICDLYDEIIQYLKFADEWEFDFLPLSYYKVIIYFDC